MAAERPLGKNNPGNPSGLSIASVLAVPGIGFRNTLVDGTPGPQPHVDQTYANQIRMTEDVNQTRFQGGAVWSREKIDLSTAFTTKFAVYAGTLPNQGDGATFTLQNDSRGQEAIGSGGGSFGVYGGNWGTAYDDHDVRDDEARERYIRNAVSLEFDTYLNDANNYGGESGDRELCTEWWQCPTKTSGHTAIVTSAPIAVQHNALQYGTTTNPLSNDQWRDVTVTWKPTGSNSGVLRYEVAGWGTPQEHTIDDVAGTFGFHGADKTVYWGFTGSAVSRPRSGPGTSPYGFSNATAFALLQAPTALTGSVAWAKQDANDSRLLAGSVWTITRPDGSAVEVADNGAQDADPAEGKIRVNGLAYGTYSLAEKKAPSGYVLDATSRPFTIQGAATVDLGAITNTRVIGSVSWVKQDAKDSRLLAGSVWTITRPDGSAVEVADNGAQDADPAEGKIRVNGLAYGTYSLAEKKAPSGYVLDATSRPFTIQGAATVDLGTITNKKIPKGPLVNTGGTRVVKH